MRAKQLSFLPPAPTEHGGELSRPGKRKTMRPFDRRRPLHLVLRATKARGDWSMLRPDRKPTIEEWAREIAKKYDVRLYRYANVGNHLHLLVLARTRRAFQAFLREFAGRVASAITGGRKAHPQKFWDMLAYSRVVSWGRDFGNLDLYFVKNLFQAAGIRVARGVRVIPLAGWVQPPGSAMG